MKYLDRTGLVVAVGIGYLLGCLLAELLPDIQFIGLFILGFVTVLCFVWPQFMIRTLVLIFIGILLGIWWWHASYIGWKATLPIGETVTITGWLTSPPQTVSSGSKAVIQVQKFSGESLGNIDNQDIKLALYFNTETELRYGESIQVKSELEIPPQTPEFDGLRYWRLRGVQAQMHIYKWDKINTPIQGNIIYAKIYSFKNYISDRMQNIIGNPEGTFLLGLLFGNPGNIPKEITESFRALGISHLIAVSGYNLTIVALWPVLLAGLIPKKWALWSSGILALVFVIFTGAPSSIVRAAVMAWAILIGKSLGRAPHSLILIILTAVAMAFANPFAVKDDAGFILSFLAFFGLIELAPLVRKYLLWLKSPNLINIASETFGAQIMALPYLLGAFGQLSYISPLINLIILPLMPAVMFVGILAVVLVSIPAVAFAKVAALIYYPLHGFLILVQDVAKTPNISTTWPKGGYFPWFLSVIIICWWLWHKYIKNELKKAHNNNTA